MGRRGGGGGSKIEAGQKEVGYHEIMFLLFNQNSLWDKKQSK